MILLFYFLGMFSVENFEVFVNEFWIVVCDSGIVFVSVLDEVLSSVMFGFNYEFCLGIGFVDLCVNGEMFDFVWNIIKFNLYL